MTLHDQLVARDACSDAVEWVGTRTIEQAWAECERGDWMLWLAGRIDIDRKLLVSAACACAEPALAFVRAGEDRPRLAIEVARAWCVGTATLDDVRAAAAAAYAAARTESLQTSAATVRAMIPIAVIVEALNRSHT